MKEADALEQKHRERESLVAVDPKQLIQIDHCARKVDLLVARRVEFFEQELAPLTCNGMLTDTSFVEVPQRKVRVSTSQMAEQFVYLFCCGRGNE